MSDAARWYVIHTYSGYENKVATNIEKAVENRFPDNTILDGEFLLDFDGKMRYGDGQRLEVYRYFVPLLKKVFPKTVVYLCMEDPQVVKAVCQG